ncbi:MAG TPA: hypothetical protein VKR06_01545 [Ktedonosporobacter sp.]|nr:hypothetical protein [Ktedonosporobacter sp.]
MSILSLFVTSLVMLIGVILSLINIFYLLGDAPPKREEESLEDYQERVSERKLFRIQEQPFAFLGVIGLITEGLLLILFLIQPAVSFFDWMFLIGIVLLQSAALLRRTATAHAARNYHPVSHADLAELQNPSPELQSPGLAEVADRSKPTRKKVR